MIHLEKFCFWAQQLVSLKVSSASSEIWRSKRRMSQPSDITMLPQSWKIRQWLGHFGLPMPLGKKNNSYYLWLGAYLAIKKKTFVFHGAEDGWNSGDLLGRWERQSSMGLFSSTYLPGCAKNTRPCHCLPGPPFLRVVLGVSNCHIPSRIRADLLIAYHKNDRFLKLSAHYLADKTNPLGITSIWALPWHPHSTCAARNWCIHADSRDTLLWVIKSVVIDLGVSCCLPAFLKQQQAK